MLWFQSWFLKPNIYGASDFDHRPTKPEKKKSNEIRIAILSAKLAKMSNNCARVTLIDRKIHTFDLLPKDFFFAICVSKKNENKNGEREFKL